jgi:hypothetical protein
MICAFKSDSDPEDGGSSVFRNIDKKLRVKCKQMCHMPANTITKLDGRETGVCWNRSTAVHTILYQGIQNMKSMPWKQAGPGNGATT